MNDYTYCDGKYIFSFGRNANEVIEQPENEEEEEEKFIYEVFGGNQDLFLELQLEKEEKKSDLEREQEIRFWWAEPESNVIELIFNSHSNISRKR